MWFVLACDAPEAARAACGSIEALTGLPVFAFPKQREFFVELRLPLEAPAGRRDAETPPC
jgi:siroheme decarboxylase